jgi:hypothetical protein
MNHETVRNRKISLPGYPYPHAVDPEFTFFHTVSSYRVLQGFGGNVLNLSQAAVDA